MPNLPVSSPSIRVVTSVALPLFLAATGAACGQSHFDETALLSRVEALASDAFEGRATGTDGAARARELILASFEEIGLSPISAGYDQAFSFTDGQGNIVEGVNLVAKVEGTRNPERYIVLSAHYDHLGIRDGEIYNGADDNASGASAILAIAEHLQQYPAGHTVILCAFDAEELGLRGARAFVEDPPVPLDSIAAVINLDMVSRSPKGELYASGGYHYPQLFESLRGLQPDPGVTLLFGHDRPEQGSDDWTSASDHGPFHAVGIPFVYFGVEDHPGYHSTEDDFEHITPRFYVAAVRTILRALLALDESLESAMHVGD